MILRNTQHSTEFILAHMIFFPKRKQSLRNLCVMVILANSAIHFL